VKFVTSCAVLQEFHTQAVPKTRTASWTTVGRSVGWFPDQRKIVMFMICSVPMVCPIPGKEAPLWLPPNCFWVDRDLKFDGAQSVQAHI
jgi:hypothetical protein